MNLPLPSQNACAALVTRISPRDRREVLVAALFLSWCALLLVARVGRTGHLAYAFLVWNLFLAAVPFALSLAIRHAPHRALAWLLIPVWLLFYPNAPYILTDVLHLRSRSGAPLWYDMLLLWSAAFTGVYFTYASLRHVQDLVTRRTGRALGRAFALGVLFLSAFGVSLGRFQRWNSWELLTSPRALVQDTLHRLFVPWDHPRTWAMTLGLGMLLSLGYAAIGVSASSARSKSINR